MFFLKKIVFIFVYVSFFNQCLPMYFMGGSNNFVEASEEIVTKTYQLTGVIDTVKFSQGELVIIQIDDDKEEELTITTHENVLPLINTEERGNCLNLAITGSIINCCILRYELKIKHLNSIRISGSGTCNIESLETDEFNIKISGSGDVNIGNLFCKRVSEKIFGSGSVNVTNLVCETLCEKVSGSGSISHRNGSVQSQTSSISGSGSINDLQNTQECSISISGSGRAKVNVSNKLNVKSKRRESVTNIGDAEIELEESHSGSMNFGGISVIHNGSSTTFINDQSNICEITISNGFLYVNGKRVN